MCIPHLTSVDPAAHPVPPQEKTLEALMVERETFPDKWADDERGRLARHAGRVEGALRWERGE